ncbi:hypothetical protein [Methylobacterium persicinum]|uniref:Uncharacterized protein n=1 Tax=Methylobacterium persicinum TaxID=374426 RepID=A0ABU0HRQ0_9HYPH|nr:hypothetical protein [Methylobacterium persicinum]MDQ0444597.1 hypothetical protein [Methylobacterium persicinum]GJE40810.1 hypothetical protein KHHGKMAE_4909 [Methylobacterium persicinum]
MKGLLLNTLLGLSLGRFGGVWMLSAFVPIVAVELAYGYFEYGLGFSAGLRRGVALLVCGELAFLLGVLMRPLPGET